MYKIINSFDTPMRTNQIVRVGLPSANEMICDLYIVSSNNSELIPLNSIVLRNALLESKDFLAKNLNIEVNDLAGKSKKAEPKPKKIKQTEEVKWTK